MAGFAQSLKFERPRRFGRGRFMTVALGRYLNWDDGRLNLDATLDVLGRRPPGSRRSP